MSEIMIKNSYDVIIIGGGLGGLTAGAKLAREGKHVLLIEQHAVPGGCATTFRHKEFLVEVGLHEMDGFGAGNLKEKIFTELGIFNQVSFPEAPHFYRTMLPACDITLPHDIRGATETLIRRFPAEEEGIRAFFRRMENFRKYRPANEDEHRDSVGSFLDRIISDETLKLVLLGNMMAFGDDPYLLSMAYYAQAQGTFYQSGGVFIKGGSQTLSDYLAGYITAHGGDVIFRHLVTGITVTGDRCTGVTGESLRDGRPFSAGAGHLVVNCALPQLAEKLLPAEYGARITEATFGKVPGASLFTMYLCFDRPLKELGNPCYCTCVYGQDVKGIADIGPNSHGRFEDKTFVLTDYSHLDSGLAPEGKSVAALVAEDYLTDWEGMTKDEYGKRKEEVTRSFLRRLEAMIPGMSDHLVWYDSATARTIHRYTLNTGGAVYGFAQLPVTSNKSRISPFENLYIASAWDKFGGGFSGVIYSGYFAALELLRKERQTKN